MTNQDLLLPFCKNVQTRQPQLASDSFFEVKLGTLSKSFGARNDNFFNMGSSILGNQGSRELGMEAVCCSLHTLSESIMFQFIYIHILLQPSLSLIYIFCQGQAIMSQKSIVHQHRNRIRQSIEKRKEKTFPLSKVAIK